MVPSGITQSPYSCLSAGTGGGGKHPRTSYNVMHFSRGRRLHEAPNPEPLLKPVLCRSGGDRYDYYCCVRCSMVGREDFFAYGVRSPYHRFVCARQLNSHLELPHRSQLVRTNAVRPLKVTNKQGKCLGHSIDSSVAIEH